MEKIISFILTIFFYYPLWIPLPMKTIISI